MPNELDELISLGSGQQQGGDELDELINLGSSTPAPVAPQPDTALSSMRFEPAVAPAQSTGVSLDLGQPPPQRQPFDASTLISHPDAGAIAEQLSQLPGRIPHAPPPPGVLNRPLSPEEQQFQGMSQAGKTVSQLGFMGAHLATGIPAFALSAYDRLSSPEKHADPVTGEGGSTLGQVGQMGKEFVGMVANLPAQVDFMSRTIARGGEPAPVDVHPQNPFARALGGLMGQTPEDYYANAVRGLYESGGAEPVFSTAMAQGGARSLRGRALPPSADVLAREGAKRGGPALEAAPAPTPPRPSVGMGKGGGKKVIQLENIKKTRGGKDYTISKGGSFISAEVVDNSLLIKSSHVPKELRRKGVYSGLLDKLLRDAKKDHSQLEYFEGNVISPEAEAAARRWKTTEELLPKETPPLLRTRIDEVLKPQPPEARRAVQGKEPKAPTPKAPKAKKVKQRPENIFSAEGRPDATVKRYGLTWDRKDGFWVDRESGKRTTTPSFIEELDSRVTPPPTARLAKGKAEDVVGFPSKRQVPVSMERKGKAPTNRDQVVDHFRRSFKLPIRVGKFRERAEGIYKRQPELVRSREANDLSTISHEVGHHLEQQVYRRGGGKSTLNPGSAATKELVELGKELYGTRKPTGSYRSEGFAEYVAHWLTTDVAKKAAPEFTKYFEDTFLKQNPEIAKSLHEGRRLVRQWREQGAVDRVYANIDVQGKKPSRARERLADGVIRARSLFEDELYPLEYAERKIRGVHKLDPRKIDPITSPTMMARAVAQTATSKARQMILHGTFDFAGKTTGKSLRKALKPIGKDSKEFLSYAYAKRAQELHKRGINPGITLEDANFVAGKLESPKFAQAFKDVTKFEDNVLQYAVDAGSLSAEAAQSIRALNTAYIPLKRVFEESSFAGTGGRRVADLGQPVKRIKGSGRRIQNPLHSIIENTAAVIAHADKARVGQALIELSEKQGAGRWIEKIPTPQQATRVPLDRIKQQLKDAGVDISEASMDQVLTVYSNAGLFKGRDNIVSFWKGGKRQFYEVDKRLYSTLKGLDEIHLNPVLDFFFGRPARTVRLGATGLNAGFGLITNPLRDAQTFALQTEFSTGSPHLVAKALMWRLKPEGDMNLLYKRSGADMSQFLGLDRKQLQRAVKEVMASDAKKKTLNVVSHPVEAMKEIFSFTESGPRLAEFEAAYRKGEKLYGKDSPQASIMANLAASDVTVNFRRAGSYGKWINATVPFWNAAVQGVGKFGRFMREHPVKGGIKAVTYLTIPSLAIWSLNKDEQWYRDMPAWQRYGFFNIPHPTKKNKDGTPVIFRIPKPFEWGVTFSSAPEMVMDYWYSKDKAVVKDGLKYMAEQTIPYDLPIVPSAIIEWSANYDFFRERPIDPFFEVKYKEPGQRYSKYTTETSKFLGRQFGLSPRKIDHLISSTTGGLGRDIIRAGENIAGVGQARGSDLADKPVIGRLFQRTETPKKREQRINYQRNEAKQKIRNMLKAGNSSGAKDKLQQWNNRHPDFKLVMPELPTRTPIERTKRPTLQERPPSRPRP